MRSSDSAHGTKALRRTRIAAERLQAALAAVERLAERALAGEKVETWELHEIAHRLQ